MDDVYLLFGLALLPGYWLIVSTATAVTLGQLLRRTPPIKTSFNAANLTCIAASGVAAAAAFHVSGPFPPDDRTFWGVIAAALAIPLVHEVVTPPAIASAAVAPGWQPLPIQAIPRLGGLTL